MSTVEIKDTKLELVKSEISIALTKAGLNYQKALQAAENITFSKETINQDYEPLKNLRQIVKSIEDIRKEKKAPLKEAADRIDNAAKSLVNPLNEVLDRKTAEFKKLADEIKAENSKFEAEKKRSSDIINSIDAYVLDKSTAISQAETDDELVRIERLINLDSTPQNLKKYDEFHHDFTAFCGALRELIKDQKEKIRSLKKLDADIAEAMQLGNDEEALEMMGRKDVTEAVIEDNKTKVQEQSATAIMAANRSYEVVTPAAPKPRQTRWTYELVDVEQALKKNRDMLDISVNAKKAAVKLDEVKASGKDDVTIDGVRYFKKEIY